MPRYCWEDYPAQLQILEKLLTEPERNWNHISKLVSEHGPARSVDACVKKATREGWLDLGVKSLSEEELRLVIGTEIDRAESKREVTQYKRMYDELLKQQAETNNLVERMKDSLETLKPISSLEISEPSFKGQEEEEAIVLISDVQLGLKSLGEEIGLEEPQLWGAYGSYNFEVLRYRIRVWVKGVLKLLALHRTSVPVRKLNIWFLGDVLENEWIFRGQGAYIETGLIQQYFAALYEFGQAIAYLSAYFEEVEVHGVAGNHGRGTERPRQSKTWVNWEWLWYRYLELICREIPNIKFDLARSWFDLPEVQGHKFLLIHGEDIRRYMRFPWYNAQWMEQGYGAILERVGSPFENLCFGHHHVAANFQTSRGEWICNGN